jgi:hypothetical protein
MVTTKKVFQIMGTVSCVIVFFMVQNIQDLELIAGRTSDFNTFILVGIKIGALFAILHFGVPLISEILK